MQVCDPQGYARDFGAQFRRFHDFSFGREGKDVEDRSFRRVDPDPGFDPVLPASSGSAAAADPDASRPAEQRGKPPASRGQADQGALDAAAPWPLWRPVPGSRQFAGEPVHELKAAQPPADRVYRYPGGAQGLDVAHDGAPRHLKLAGELPGTHPAAGLEQADQADKTAGTHSPKIIPNHDS